MSTHLKRSVVGSKIPTQLAPLGAKMTSPLLVVEAPQNLPSLLMVDRMSMQLKRSVVGSKMPTQST